MGKLVRGDQQHKRLAADDPLSPAEMVDVSRLRAVVRLLFNGEEAERLVALATTGGQERLLERTVALVKPRYTLARWRARLPRGSRSGPLPPLGPTANVATNGALGLALHLGFGLDGERLATLLGMEPDRFGVVLAQARTLTAGAPRPCKEFAALVGRYRDPALGIMERASLYRHAQECERCRAALETAQEIDDRLSAAINAALPALPAWSPRVTRAQRLRATPGTRVALALLLVGLLAAGGIVGSWLLAGPHHPVPLVANADGIPASTRIAPSGWLLFDPTDGALVAINPATRAHREIAPSPLSGAVDVARALSPNGKLLATFVPPYVTSGPAPTSVVIISSIDGKTLHSFSLGGPGTISWTAGWLGNRALLLFDLSQDSRLISLDAATGKQRVIFQSSDVIDAAVASPDGSLIALKTSQHGASSFTLELRPVRPDGLGPPVARFENQPFRSAIGASGIVWAPDSQRLYDEMGNIPASAGAALPVRAGLVAIDRSGYLSLLGPEQTGQYAEPISVSPDGQRVAYQVEQQPNVTNTRWETWIVNRDGTNAHRLAVSSGAAGAVTWTSGGTMLLLNSQPLWPAAANASDADETTLPVLFSIDSNGDARPLLSLPTALGPLVGWVPADAISAPPVGSDSTAMTVGAPEPVDGVEPYRITAYSSVSPDGSTVLLWDPARGSPELWSLADQTATAGILISADPAWYPEWNVLIGTTVAGSASSFSGNELVTFASPASLGPTGIGLRETDPANILNDGNRRYARPLVSSDGLAVSFFVVDEPSGTAQLWLANWGHSARSVTRFQIHGTALGDAPLTACWVDPETLVFIEPGDWQAGLPRSATLMRLSINPDGTTSIKALTSERIQGSDRGLIVTDLALSPDGSRISERLRHFTHADTHSGLYDTLVVAPSSDLTQRFEIARGLPGDGLAWAPDSGRLAFGLDSRLTIASADGRTLASVETSGARAGYPLWVGPDQLWFSESDASGSRVMQVRVR